MSDIQNNDKTVRCDQFHNSGYLVKESLLHLFYQYIDDTGLDKDIFTRYHINATVVGDSLYNLLDLPDYECHIRAIRVPRYQKDKTELALALLNQLQNIRCSKDITEWRNKRNECKNR